jgi:hypothetical protein
VVSNGSNSISKITNEHWWLLGIHDKGGLEELHGMSGVRAVAARLLGKAQSYQYATRVLSPPSILYGMNLRTGDSVQMQQCPIMYAIPSPVQSPQLALLVGKSTWKFLGLVQPSVGKCCRAPALSFGYWGGKGDGDISWVAGVPSQRTFDLGWPHHRKGGRVPYPPEPPSHNVSLPPVWRRPFVSQVTDRRLVHTQGQDHWKGAGPSVSA